MQNLLIQGGLSIHPAVLTHIRVAGSRSLSNCWRARVNPKLVTRQTTTTTQSHIHIYIQFRNNSTLTLQPWTVGGNSSTLRRSQGGLSGPAPNQRTLHTAPLCTQITDYGFSYCLSFVDAHIKVFQMIR